MANEMEDKARTNRCLCDSRAVGAREQSFCGGDRRLWLPPRQWVRSQFVPR